MGWGCGRDKNHSREKYMDSRAPALSWGAFAPWEALGNVWRQLWL